VHQVGHYPESHQDARSTKHKKLLIVFGIVCDMENNFRNSTATILSVSDILFPAQLYILICTVTESSCGLVCYRVSLTKWATGSHGQFRNADATDMSACVTRVTELRMENPVASHKHSR
jgi:hypothetical protein